MLDENVVVNVGDTFMLIDEFNGPIGPINIKKVTRAYIIGDREGDEYTFHQDGWAIGYSGQLHLAVITPELEEEREKKRFCQDILGTRAMEDLLAGVSLENLSLKRLQRMKQVKDDLLKEVYEILDIQDGAEKTALDKD